MKRKCTYCGKEITACFGYVMAGDWLKFLNHEITGEEIRELCGLCVFRMEGDYTGK